MVAATVKTDVGMSALRRSMRSRYSIATATTRQPSGVTSVIRSARTTAFWAPPRPDEPPPPAAALTAGTRLATTIRTTVVNRIVDRICPPPFRQETQTRPCACTAGSSATPRSRPGHPERLRTPPRPPRSSSTEDCPRTRSCQDALTGLWRSTCRAAPAARGKGSRIVSNPQSPRRGVAFAGSGLRHQRGEVCSAPSEHASDLDE
jgi:hypothetical protein